MKNANPKTNLKANLKANLQTFGKGVGIALTAIAATLAITLVVTAGVALAQVYGGWAVLAGVALLLVSAVGWWLHRALSQVAQQSTKASGCCL